jgi:hypothetical protein
MCEDFKRSKGLAARFQNPPPNSKAVNFKKYVENCKKFRKMPN